MAVENDPAASDVRVDTQTLTVTLQDGRQLSAPLSWYPRLLAGTEAERNDWELLGKGYAIMWPSLDEHIGIEGLLAGRRSTEKTESLERWLATR